MIGSQHDIEVRTVDACKEALNEAFGLVFKTGHERLKKLINEAIEEAALLSVLENDKVNERT